MNARCEHCCKTFEVTLKPHEKNGTYTGSVVRICPRCGETVYVWTGKVKEGPI